MASFWIRLIICAAAFAAFGVAAVYGPSGASRIETILAGQATERLSAAGLTWALANAEGRRLVLTGEAPSPEDAALALETAGGRGFQSGVIAVDSSKLTIAPQAIPIETYEFSARLEAGKLTVDGMLPSEGAFVRLTEAFGARPNLVIDRKFKLEAVENAEAWLEAATTGMHALSLLENGALEQKAAVFALSGNAGDRSSIDAVKSVIAGAPGPFTFQLSLESAAPTEGSRLCQAAVNKVLNGRPLTFTSGSANLSRADRSVLDRLGNSLGPCTGLTIVIEGHTDSNGDQSANIRLSERRAAAVRDHLIAINAPVKFTTRAYGASRPIAPNRSAAGQRRNRRIDFTVAELEEEQE